MLLSKYETEKLFEVTSNTCQDPGAAPNDLDLDVRAGDLVAVIQQKDPLGNRDRWFCDSGLDKGFISASLLKPYKQSEQENTAHEVKPVAVVAPYDEVTEDVYKKPTRRAPPVPKTREDRCDETSPRADTCEQASVHSYEEIAASQMRGGDSRGDPGQWSVASTAPSNAETISSCWDLSPVYEEIPGGSRSSVSSSSGRSVSKII